MPPGSRSDTTADMPKFLLTAFSRHVPGIGIWRLILAAGLEVCALLFKSSPKFAEVLVNLQPAIHKGQCL